MNRACFTGDPNSIINIAVRKHLAAMQRAQHAPVQQQHEQEQEQQQQYEAANAASILPTFQQAQGADDSMSGTDLDASEGLLHMPEHPLQGVAAAARSAADALLRAADERMAAGSALPPTPATAAQEHWTSSMPAATALAAAAAAGSTWQPWDGHRQAHVDPEEHSDMESDEPGSMLQEHDAAAYVGSEEEQEGALPAAPQRPRLSPRSLQRAYDDSIRQ